MTINEVQDDIIEDFSFLEGDLENKVYYIMELGNDLPPLPKEEYRPENLVKGCQSKVWLTSKFEGGTVHFSADSNTDITKGLISMLIKIWENRTPEEIVHSDLYFIDKIGMNRVLSSQRSNGFASMIEKMRNYARAFIKK